MDIRGLVEEVLRLGNDELELVFEAARIRDRQLRADKVAANFADLTPGTHVRTCGDLRPKLLLGVTGKVAPIPAKRSGDLMIEVDRMWRGHASRYIDRHTGLVAIPANCLERV